MIDTNYIELEYSKKDIQYIDELINYIKIKSQDIVDFFGNNYFKEKVIVKLFDDVNDFRNNCYKIRNHKEVPLWLSGLSFYKNNKYIIYTLCLSEYKKTKGHENSSLDELKKLIMHEFVHACHQQFTEFYPNPCWLSEGIASFLSEQYTSKDMDFNATLEQITNGGTNYKNYYIMFSYVFNEYGKEYVLELIKDNNKLIDETPKLYNEVKKFINNN